MGELEDLRLCEVCKEAKLYTNFDNSSKEGGIFICDNCWSDDEDAVINILNGHLEMKRELRFRVMKKAKIARNAKIVKVFEKMNKGVVNDLEALSYNLGHTLDPNTDEVLEKDYYYIKGAMRKLRVAASLLHYGREWEKNPAAYCFEPLEIFKELERALGTFETTKEDPSELIMWVDDEDDFILAMKILAKFGVY